MTTAIEVGVIVTVSAVILYGPLVVATNALSGWWLFLTALWALFGTVTVLALVVQAMPNEHAWPGGSGSSTTCYYETRLELVGKVMVPQRWTVCR